MFVQSVVWGNNAFDQWGVELGKKLCEQLHSTGAEARERQRAVELADGGAGLRQAVAELKRGAGLRRLKHGVGKPLRYQYNARLCVTTGNSE